MNADNQDTPPILFLIFNRPDLTAQTFEAIRKASPKMLFIAADGPRTRVVDEAEVCIETRRIVEKIDWPCEVFTRFRHTNLGCEIAVSDAITWFFEHVEAGIILEDDCLPNPSFFPFCATLLDRYATDHSVMAITGNNFQDGRRHGRSDYYFSKYLHCWGWASWRRAWAEYDHDLTGASIEEVAARYEAGHSEVEDWTKKFNSVKSHQLNTWDYRWVYSIWKNDGLVATPQKNLVMNIGFDERATHTKHGVPITAESLEIRNHPRDIKQERRADSYVAKHHFRIFIPTPAQRVTMFLGSIRRAIWQSINGS